MGMSRRAYILKIENNKFEGISLQHDGDLNSAGYTLQHHYTKVAKVAKVAKVEELLNSSECSELCETVQDSIFYEKKIGNVRFKSMRALMLSIHKVDYIYIFEGGEWFVLTNYSELEGLERALELDLY